MSCRYTPLNYTIVKGGFHLAQPRAASQIQVGNTMSLYKVAGCP